MYIWQWFERMYINFDLYVQILNGVSFSITPIYAAFATVLYREHVLCLSFPAVFF